ncbi:MULTISPECIES: tetratricopeptide repeat protein [unclassified Jeotgalibaca]|uniref:tetratricopeptide repeat protein n=1 Tax=unclassified Jeotgalibaca TaxID=2621505 RepID=UPI003FD45F77
MNSKAEKMFEAIRENEVEIAQVYFNESLEQSIQESDIDGLADFAEELHHAGFVDEATRTYRLLKQLAPQFEEWDLYLAELAIDNDQVSDGIDILLQFDESSELYPNVLLVLADAYQSLGLYEVSEQKILEAIKILPDEPVLKYALAKLFYSIGSFKKAIPLYEELLELNDEMPWEDNILMQLAECHHAIGQFEEGIQYLEQLHSEEHSSDSLFQLGFGYLQMKAYGRSIQIFEELLEKDPDYLSVYLYLAQALEADQRLPEALEAMLKGIEENPFQAEFYLAAANLQRKQKRTEEAEKLLDKAIELEPEFIEAILLKVDLALDDERYEDVVTYLESNPDNANQPHFQWKLALAHDKLEDYDVASAYFEKAHRYFDDNLDFLEDYSTYLQEEGNLEKLATVVRHALTIEPNHPYFLDMMLNHLS